MVGGRSAVGITGGLGGAAGKRRRSPEDQGKDGDKPHAPCRGAAVV